MACVLGISETKGSRAHLKSAALGRLVSPIGGDVFAERPHSHRVLVAAQKLHPGQDGLQLALPMVLAAVTPVGMVGHVQRVEGLVSIGVVSTLEAENKVSLDYT